jgi:hypothetical protein
MMLRISGKDFSLPVDQPGSLIVAVNAAQIARLLRELRTALRGGDPYRARAYARALPTICSRSAFQSIS